jgi:hypothetical protein
MATEKPKINIVAPIKPDINVKVVTALRAALKEAKEGRIQAVGIAIACLDPEGDAGRSTETILSAADGWYHSLSCAINGLAFRMQYERYVQGVVMPNPKVEDGDE